MGYSITHNNIHTTLHAGLEDVKTLEVFIVRQVRLENQSSRLTGEDRKTVKTSEVKSPGQQFSNFFNAYSKRISRAYGRTGSLFENRYRRKEVTTDRYFLRLIHYIHWNPQKHGFVTDFRDYPYSSYQIFLMEKPTFVQRIEVLAWFDGRDGFIKRHQELVDEKNSQDWLIDEGE